MNKTLEFNLLLDELNWTARDLAQAIFPTAEHCRDHHTRFMLANLDYEDMIPVLLCAKKLRDTFNAGQSEIWKRHGHEVVDGIVLPC